MKTILFNNIGFSSDMSLYTIRKILLKYHTKLLSDKIRVFSLVYKDSKNICEKLWIKFEGYFLAIWEMNYKSFPKIIQEKWWFLKWSDIYKNIIKWKESIIDELEKNWISQYQYDLTWTWYKMLRKLLSQEEFYRIWIRFNYEDDNNEIFVVNWASFWLKSVFEMFYRKLWRKVRTIFPVPMFMPILLASDIFLDSIIFETKEENNFKITKKDIEDLLKNNKQIDVFYLCLLNNPTSISYTKQEIEELFTILFSYNKNIQVIIDWVYISWWDIEEIHSIFWLIKEKWWLDNIILVDWEWKAKARTWKRSGSIYIKNKENSNILSNVIRNSTWWISSDLMIETISVLKELDDNISQIIYNEISIRREFFLDYIFEDKNISKFLEERDKQFWLKKWFKWKWWLYVFLKLKELVSSEEFILNTWIIWTPGEVFGSKKYTNYIRLSFGYENFNI